MTARLATATTRAPEENRPSSVAWASAGTVVQRARTPSGAPFAISSRPAGASTRTEASCRSWSKGRLSRIGQPPPSSAEPSTAAQSARSSSLPALSLHARPSSRTRFVGLAETVERPREGDVALGQRAGLVREQHLDVAEILDADQALDDHPSSCQAAGAGGQADGHDRRQQLRRQPDGDREREQRRLEHRAAERDVDQEDRARQHRGDGREQTREGLQPLLERGLPLPLAQPQRDRAERRLRAGANDEAAPVAAPHERPHERAGREIERRLAGRLRIGRLRGRLRLSRQHRLVALELVRRQHPQVGGHDVADAQMHDVARNDLGDVDLGRLAVALDERQVPDLGVQRLDRLLRPVLVHEAQPDAHRHDPADDQRLGEIADDRRHDRRDEQQAEEIAAHLADENRQRAHAARPQDVRPVHLQAPARLDARKTRLRRVELGEHARGRQRSSSRKVELLRLLHRKPMLRTGQRAVPSARNGANRANAPSATVCPASPCPDSHTSPPLAASGSRERERHHEEEPEASARSAARGDRTGLRKHTSVRDGLQEPQRMRPAARARARAQLARAHRDRLHLSAAGVRDRHVRRRPARGRCSACRRRRRRRPRRGRERAVEPAAARAARRRSRRPSAATTCAPPGCSAGSTSTSCCSSTSTGSSAAATASTCCRSREELAQPLVVTLHTVLSEPTPHQAEVLTELCAQAELVIVMTETALRLLVDSRRLPGGEGSRRAARRAGPAHRARGSGRRRRSRPRASRARASERFLLSTFGLISPGKGLETVIEALPAIVERHPEVVYTIAGRTHPDIAHREGERYRLMLERRVLELGLGDHVEFDDRFLSIDELSDLLAATDVFVTPYRNREQIASGALTFAIAAGCGVVSTPYWYAQDMLASGAGRLVPFDDPAGARRCGLRLHRAARARSRRRGRRRGGSARRSPGRRSPRRRRRCCARRSRSRRGAGRRASPTSISRACAPTTCSRSSTTSGSCSTRTGSSPTATAATASTTSPAWRSSSLALARRGDEQVWTSILYRALAFLHAATGRAAGCATS